MQTDPSPMQGGPTLWSKVTAVTDWFAFPLRTSHYVELVNPLWASHSLQARVEKVWEIRGELAGRPRG